MWCNALRHITAQDIVEASMKALELEDKSQEKK
jgi:hypothetical protein